MKTLKYLFASAGFYLFLLPALFSQKEYSEAREKMVATQVEARGISDPATLSAMKKVKRHLFIPEGSQYRAYHDGPVPIGFGQTISQPYIVALMTEIIGPKPGDKVLEIGTGSGYQAAVLAEIVDQVYTVEIIPQLGESAAGRLADLGYDNVNTKIDDGYYGWEKHGPYDAIVVTAAADFIPPPLTQQLKEGGKMIIPVGSPFRVQTLMLVEKTGGKITTKSLLPVRFVPFTRK